MIKKIFITMICAMLIFVLSSCGQSESKTEVVSESTKAAESIENQTKEVQATEESNAASDEESSSAADEESSVASDSSDENEDAALKLYLGETEVPVAWEDNQTVDELMADAKEGDIVVNMSMYGGWEQVGSLGKTYTRNDVQMTAQNGDITLYSGDQIVVFYGENSWAYTKLGKIDLPEDEITEMLSNGDITLTLKRCSIRLLHLKKPLPRRMP